MQTMQEVRVRFAPSPTGHLHIGGGRTALYNYLFAKHHHGKFILRIEDTDRERSTPEATQGILESLKWLGLAWNEGPFFQSENLNQYLAAVQSLLEQKKAYPCYCSNEELNAMREEATKKGEKPRYDGRCRHLKSPPTGKESVKPVIRFCGPDNGNVEFTDLIRGKISFACKELDDLIILRSDGSPTYNLCVVIDDAQMRITHVIRGDDHLNNTPRQILLYQALGKPIPQFAHLSMILGPDKKKLSKRHNVPSIMEYETNGFVPQALNNYLVRLGWSHGDQEIFSMDELVELFSFEAIGSSPAAINFEKLLWLNGHYIREGKKEEIWPALEKILKTKDVQSFPPQEFCYRVMDLVKERCKTLVEMADLALPFLREEIVYDEEAGKKFLNIESKEILEEVIAQLATLAPFDVGSLKICLEKIAEAKQVKFVKIAQPLRVALTGSTVSPGIYEVIELLGREKTLSRLQHGLNKIKEGE